MCINAPISFWGHLSRAESHILEELWCGLCHLYGIVKRLEQTRLEQDPKAKDRMVMTFDGDCGSGDRMLLNYFLWYSCSADSFLDLFATTFAAKKNPKVFNNMRKFRDNVGAHLPHDNPNRERRRGESRETKSASLCQHITWHCGRYSIGREFYVKEDGETSPREWGWELTAVHEELDAYIRQKLSKSTQASGAAN